MLGPNTMLGGGFLLPVKTLWSRTGSMFGVGSGLSFIMFSRSAAIGFARLLAASAAVWHSRSHGALTRQSNGQPPFWGAEEEVVLASVAVAVGRESSPETVVDRSRLFPHGVPGEAIAEAWCPSSVSFFCKSRSSR